MTTNKKVRSVIRFLLVVLSLTAGTVHAVEGDQGGLPPVVGR